MKHRTNCSGEWMVGDMVFDRDYKDHNPPMQIITKLYRKLYNMFDTDLENGVKKENFINISEIARAAGREI